jgi:hypothetical protein
LRAEELRIHSNLRLKGSIEPVPKISTGEFLPG